MSIHPFDNLDRIYALMVPVKVRKPIPYMGTDGRLELFTDQKLADAAVAYLEANLHIHTEVRQLEGRDAVLDFFRACTRDGMVFFRLNNGSKVRQEYKFDDLFSFREPTLVEEMNRTVRYYLTRSKVYVYYRSRLPEEERSGKFGMSLAEIELTMRYNAYREMYRGILYALASEADSSSDLDHYTVAALDLAKARLKEKRMSEAGYTAVSLIHKPNQGGSIYTSPLRLFYVNSPGQVGNISNGLVCAFTSYEAAASGKALFQAHEKPCAIVALTAQELMGHALQCAGVLIDMGETEYQIPKQEFGLWKTYGELDAPIMVSLNTKKGTANEKAESPTPPSPTAAKEEGASQ